MRSLLLVPSDGDLRSAERAGADVLVVDVAGASADALGRVAAFLAGERALPVYLRVSPLASRNTAAELDALVSLRPEGIVLAGAEGGTSVTRLSAMLRPREALANIPDGAIAIVATATDSAAGVLALGSYAGASARLAALACDTAALAESIGASSDSDTIRLARTMTVLGAAAAGVAAIEGPFRNASDPAGLEAEARAASRDGFGAKFAIHPDQVAVINRVFSPSASSR